MDFFEEMEARIPKGKVRTRFAPSPTGYMHVGNLRTALYTWLIARSQGGTFILRIEDTDQGRLVEGAVDVIYKTMAQCGLDHDEGPDVGGPVGPYIQSERRGLFGKYAELLVERGGAYHCFCQKSDEEPEETDSKDIKKHKCACSGLTLDEARARIAAGESYVIRQRIPQEGSTTFHDASFGDITVENAELEEQVLLKSDGLPTYNFANVVDDHLMGITHVVRGSEYLSSAPKYNLLYESFGWDIPTYVHCSPVMRDQHNKMSKRHGDPSYEEAIRMYNNSMSELKTDYIDYYLLHSLSGGGDGFNRRFVDNGVIDFLLEERKAGRVRNLGFSFHGSAEGFDQLMAIHDKYHWDFVQIQMNYIDWKMGGAEYLYEELAKRQIPVVIMEPLLGGRLSKVPDNIVARLKGRDPDHSVASWAFRFAGSPEGILTVLSGMTYMEHLQDNVSTYSPLHQLTDDDNRFLIETAQLIQKYPLIPCNDCKYCMPCPYGIDIPAVLTYYNKRVTESSLPTDRESPDYRRVRRSFLDEYDRAVPSLRQADHCIGCRTCVEECPQKIDIPQQLRRIDEYVEKLKQNTL